MLDRIVGAASIVPFVIGSLSGPALPPGEVVFSYQDPAIVESSGLVVTDGLFVTVNDSGDGGRVFAVSRSGDTVGTTTWADDPQDTEALAPAEPGSVWVADTGDNRATRDSVEVLKVPVGRGDREVTPERYVLTYPDGAHDAETLMADPRSGRLLIVSKNLFGGTVYAAPRTLSADHANRLKAVADSVGFATDGSFFPDGRHYVVRDYTSATVFTFPGHEEVGSFRLPAQEQGEGIAVDAAGSVFIGTEGQFSDVLRIELPRAVERAMAPPSSSPSPDAVASDADGSGPEEDERPSWPWLLGGGVLVLGFVAGATRLLTRHGAAS